MFVARRGGGKIADSNQSQSKMKWARSDPQTKKNKNVQTRLNVEIQNPSFFPPSIHDHEEEESFLLPPPRSSGKRSFVSSISKGGGTKFRRRIWEDGEKEKEEEEEIEEA